MKTSSLLVALLSAALAAGPALANPPEGKGKPAHAGKGNKAQSEVSTGDLVAAGITAVAAHALLNELGISTAGYKPLPPGIRKNLARGKPLPPGIAKRSLPVPYLERLPKHPGYEWQSVGTDLVLVAIGTAIVADVLHDVFR